MPLTALALVLVAALLHAGWNIVAKRSGGGPHFVLMGGLMIIVLWSPLGLWLAWHEVPRWARPSGWPSSPAGWRTWCTSTR